MGQWGHLISVEQLTALKCANMCSLSYVLCSVNYGNIRFCGCLLCCCITYESKFFHLLMGERMGNKYLKIFVAIWEILSLLALMGCL